MAAVECKVCTKKAYPLESISVDGDTYHKSCFKCHECKAPLTLKNMAKINGTPFCKPHFKQMFAEAGGDYGVFGANPEHKQWEKVAYSPGVVVNAAVVSDAKSPTADGAAAVRGPGHLRSASAAVAATGASTGGSSAVPHQHVRAQSAPAVVDVNHEALLVLITQKDVAAVKKHVQQHGVSQLFAVDSRKKTPIEIAFTEGANSVGNAMIEALQHHIAALELSAGVAPTSSTGKSTPSAAAAAAPPTTPASISEEPAEESALAAAAAESVPEQAAIAEQQ